MRRLMPALLCLLLAWAPFARAQGTPSADDASVLVLGRVSDDPKAHYDQLKPLLDYVIPRMASVGIRSGRILMAKDLQQMTSYLRRGRVDWINETAGNAALLEYRDVARSLLISEREGATRYHSLFFVRRDSPVQSLQDLAGRSVAFQSPLSTSAYFLPAAQLLENGQSLELLLSPMDKPAADRVGYVFARTELNITTWVHKRMVDAGVLSNLDWINPARMPPTFSQDFRVIARTPDVPRALILTRRGMDPRVEARLREVLMDAANDPEAVEALRRFMDTVRFVPIDDDERRALEQLATGVQRVRAEVE
ncbi:phosphate/phosphite/phosphonate ABC transporter substrate-binding protein [Thermomonas fusca]|uniref:phosphate/phosphite/phosphonate ABC transporter substrate-binding protein n=1 Tax=Thermomonas fusca TaxID=215690 RepID=UPI00040708FB|nr:phosphate/phosphite/phosphonate ABC transporter substrate-binding protein [Thermomonas fusca]